MVFSHSKSSQGNILDLTIISTYDIYRFLSFLPTTYYLIFVNSKTKYNVLLP